MNVAEAVAVCPSCASVTRPSGPPPAPPAVSSSTGRSDEYSTLFTTSAATPVVNRCRSPSTPARKSRSTLSAVPSDDPTIGNLALSTPAINAESSRSAR